MKRTGMNIGSTKKRLGECRPASPLRQSENIDPAPQYCPSPQANPQYPNQNDVGNEQESWIEEAMSNKVGLGTSGLCDPMQTGQILNDLDNPQRDVVY